MISQEAIEKILGIKTKTDLRPEEMVKKSTFTIFPYNEKECSKEILVFLSLLRVAFIELNIKLINYSDALELVPLLTIVKKFLKICVNDFLYVLLQIFHVEHGYNHIHIGAIFNLAKRHRIKKGIAIIAIGENEISRLPMDYVSSFTRNPIITILDCPPNINEQSNFSDHFNLAMNMFSYNMTQIVILADKEKWIIYNFNASHPVYSIHHSFKENILSALIPKVAAPIIPPFLSDFIIKTEDFDVDTEPYKSLADDFIDGGILFNETNLYPPGKKVNELPFRNGFYRWIGQIHLDYRSGMSFGFLARQLSSSPGLLIPYADFLREHPTANTSKDYFIYGEHIYVALEIDCGKYYLCIPPVWIMTQRSGSDKTHINIHKDILLLGLVDGEMYLRTPRGTKLKKDYRPSFDTKVILAHAVGNVIISSVINHLSNHDRKQGNFSEHITKNGAAIVHWHGYIRKSLVPSGWSIHGFRNPHVACSTAQSAIYALRGKLDAFNDLLRTSQIYRGDVHIEPHHGTNITFTSIQELARFLLKTPGTSELGNKYLKDYL